MAPERATIIAMLVAACGSPLPSVAPVTVDAPPSLVSVVDAGPPLPPDVEGVVDVVKPATTCNVAPSGWEADVFWARDGGWMLRVAAGGPVYARVKQARIAELSLMAPAGVFFSGNTTDVGVSGFLELQDLHVRTRSVVVFGGFFAPSRSLVGLSIAGVAGDHVTVRAAVPDGVELLGSTHLQADVMCDDVALYGLDSDDSFAWDGAVPLRTALLPAKRKVALSVGPTDPPVAQVLLDRPATVSVLEEHGGRARLLWLATTGRVLGWVASGDLRPALPVGRSPTLAESTRLAILRDVAELGMGGLVGTRSAQPPPEALAPATGQERVACVEPVRILVELGGRRYAVGQIPAGAIFVVRRRDGAVSDLVAPASLNLAQGVAVFVPSREIVGCTATRARKSSIREGVAAPAARNFTPTRLSSGLSP